MSTHAAYTRHALFRVYAWSAWWQACHQHTLATQGADAAEAQWPLSQDSAAYADALDAFTGAEILALPADARATAMGLLPVEFHAMLTAKTITPL